MGWATKQVDCTNTFVQVEIKETGYIETPTLFGPKSGKYLVILLLKSLYGLKQATKRFYKKLIDRWTTGKRVHSILNLFMFVYVFVLSTWMIPSFLGRMLHYWRGK
jgi:hypothetical protein